MGDWDGNHHRITPLPTPKRHSSEVTYDRLVDEFNRIIYFLTDDEKAAWQTTMESLYDIRNRK